MQEFQLLLLFVEMDNFHRLRRYERIENAQRLLRPVRNYVDPFNYFDDTNFYCNYRFTPAEVFEITRRIEVDVAPRGDRGRPIPTEQRVLLFCILSLRIVSRGCAGTFRMFQQHPCAE